MEESSNNLPSIQIEPNETEAKERVEPNRRNLIQKGKEMTENLSQTILLVQDTFALIQAKQGEFQNDNQIQENQNTKVFMTLLGTNVNLTI